MEAYNFFLDREGHLRSGWRLAIFCTAFLICLQITQVTFIFLLSVISGRSAAQLGDSVWLIVCGHGAILASSLVVGWACSALMEELPFAALGALPHQRWSKNFLIGSLLGAVTLF